MNLIAPHINFLETLRTLCTQHNSVLIFDEVMTVFVWIWVVRKDSIKLHLT